MNMEVSESGRDSDIIMYSSESESDSELVDTLQMVTCVRELADLKKDRVVITHEESTDIKKGKEIDINIEVSESEKSDSEIPDMKKSRAINISTEVSNNLDKIKSKITDIKKKQTINMELSNILDSEKSDKEITDIMEIREVDMSGKVSNTSGLQECHSWTVIRASPDDLPRQDDFKTIRMNPEEKIKFSGRDFTITSRTSTTLRIRCCPEDDYENITEVLKEEGLIPATPIMQIEDFISFLADSSTIIRIRHNVYNWERYRKCHIRAYHNIHNLESYEDLEAEMFEDFIKVCGKKDNDENSGKKEQGSVLEINRQQRNNRSGSGSNDEGFGQDDGSPMQSVSSLVHVARPEDICNVRLYFSRRKNENRCPAPHEITVHAVLDKKAKIREFLEEELPECGREEAAERIRVAIFCNQNYIPLLGECTLQKPEVIWEERSSFSSFSYNSLNQKGGFFKIQKKLPPFMLYCDRRIYFMMRLTTLSNGKLPDDPIYNHGANIDPILCSKFSQSDSSFVSSASSSLTQTFAISAPQPAAVDKAPILLTPGPSYIWEGILPVEVEIVTNEQNKEASSEEDIQMMCPKDPLKKRRNKAEIGLGEGGLKCPHCETTLSRKQTFNDHINKFHPQNADGFTIKVLDRGKGTGKGKSKRKGKGKGEGKKSYDSPSLHSDTNSLVRNITSGHLCHDSSIQASNNDISTHTHEKGTFFCIKITRPPFSQSIPT
eukprot:GFUD01133303.1.p1 GENE.GFUD01133303.1~~GFUD01133303.1.p1  ORF type:complete len:753 (+),score=146.01 GFUD01133303.1:101-2260(+)